MDWLSRTRTCPKPVRRHSSSCIGCCSCLYAEDRGLLPVNDTRYDDHGWRKRVREDVARRMAEQDTFSAAAGHYYNRLTAGCMVLLT